MAPPPSLQSQCQGKPLPSLHVTPPGAGSWRNSRGSVSDHGSWEVWGEVPALLKPSPLLPPFSSRQNSLSSEQQKFAIQGVPSLLEVAGFSYFYGAFLVGPQFSMNHYRKMVQGQLSDKPGQIPNR